MMNDSLNFHYDFTVIIPFRDCTELLERAIDSIPDDTRIQVLAIDNSLVPLQNDYFTDQRMNVEILYADNTKGAGHARNVGLENAKGKWVLFLDADERIDALLAEQIKKAVSDKTLKQYSMLRRIHAFGFEYKHGIFKPDEVIRLFPAKKVHYENKVHERPICDLPKEKLNGYIEHYTYDSWQSWWDKAGHYTTIWAEDAYNHGKRTSVGSAFFHAFYGFLRAYIIQLGFLDGWSGLYSSAFHACYILLKYCKLYELQTKK